MWRYEKLIIGFDDLPIKDYPNIPDPLSTKIEGFRMEAIEREDLRNKHHDLRVRMPIVAEAQGTQVKPPFGNTLAARMRRFRTLACLYCWGLDRDGSVRDRQFVISKLPQQCKNINCTHGFRDLFEHEVVERESLTFGRCLNDAGGREVRAISRNKRKAGLQAKYEKMLKRHMHKYFRPADEDTDIHSSTYEIEHYFCYRKMPWDDFGIDAIHGVDGLQPWWCESSGNDLGGDFKDISCESSL